MKINMNGWIIAVIASGWLWFLIIMIFCTGCTINISASSAEGHAVDSITDDTKSDAKADLSIPFKAI